VIGGDLGAAGDRVSFQLSPVSLTRGYLNSNPIIISWRYISVDTAGAHDPLLTPADPASLWSRFPDLYLLFALAWLALCLFRLRGVAGKVITAFAHRFSVFSVILAFCSGRRLSVAPSLSAFLCVGSLSQ